jgi:hypothetical protein
MCPTTPISSDYEYDVFFSYKRHGLTLEWTRGVHTRLKYWITQELGKGEARLFVDDESIETGARWPEKLRDALRLSKCMVCVWSPWYFQSSWCVSEWRSFLEREKRLNMTSHGLIAPMRFHDGEHFPDEARIVQCTDVSPYTSTVPGFWTSGRALELEDQLKAVARSVAGMIRSAPPFEPDWPVYNAHGIEPGRIELAKL